VSKNNIQTSAEKIAQLKEKHQKGSLSRRELLVGAGVVAAGALAYTQLDRLWRETRLSEAKSGRADMFVAAHDHASGRHARRRRSLPSLRCRSDRW